MHWFQYHDHPRGGRGDGEDYNFGLVDVHDKPYEELIDALRGVHRRVGQLHASARLSSPSKDYTVPAAVIDPRDRSLADWPKERALVPPLISPPPEVAFGDVYLAWSQAGFSLATISMDYYDPHLLTFEGEFPVEEAFRVEWGIDAGAGPHRFALYIVPPREFPANAAPMFEARLCRRDGSACAPVPGAIATYFGSDQPRITAEAFLPWTALGVDGPPPTGRLRLELTATAFHRSRWMTLSGLAATDGLAHPARWRVLRLADSPSAFPERRDGQAEP